jgi:hypothetical protein
VSQDPPVLIATGPCYMHPGLFSFDPDRVVTIWVDPETDCPPDVDPVTLQPISHDAPRFETRMARSVQQMICPACCKQLNDHLRAHGQEPSFDETDTSDGQVRGPAMTRQPLPLPVLGDLAVDIPRWEYRTPHQGHNGFCRLRVWKSAEVIQRVAVVTEIPDNPGMSITNSAAFILPVLHACYPGPLVVFEHYHGNTDSRAGWARKERIDWVYLLGRLAQWQPVWPVSPAHPGYPAHALWAAVYFQEVTGCPPPDAPLTDRLM